MEKVHGRQQTDEIRQASFENEIKQLNNFSGRLSPHLVTLLAAFEHKGGCYLLFPYASANLDRHWENASLDVNDHASVLWLASQLSGLMGAVDIIHNPEHLVGKSGRHGDIKPENVLCYKSDSDKGRGTLVLTDMGFTAVHRDVSRSNIPNEEIPNTPLYRPPECEAEGAKISRAFDVWTLGCLYLDLIIWLLWGYKGINEFSQSRMSTDLTGCKANIYYETMRVQEGQKTLGAELGSDNRYTISVKRAVAEVCNFEIPIC